MVVASDSAIGCVFGLEGNPPDSKRLGMQRFSYHVNYSIFNQKSKGFFSFSEYNLKSRFSFCALSTKMWKTSIRRQFRQNCPAKAGQLVEKVLFLRAGHPVTAPTPTPPRGEGLCLEGTAYPQPAKGLRPLNLTRFFDRLNPRFAAGISFSSWSAAHA